ncbi:MAG: head-tail connector protein [Rhodobacteraceae bacterium]|nr:head-tail connector protein [Paracoccaceae bacterium]
MDLIETSAVDDGDLPVAALRAHLRLGAGFADEATVDALLLQYLRAAMATIEARIGKALMTRDFRLTLPCWRWADAQALPVAPVTVVTSVTLIDASGLPELVDPARWRLIADRHRPQLAATGAVLPMVPTKGAVEIAFSAGFGAVWDAVPDDLRQAVMLLAAQYYEHRSEGSAALPGAVEALLGRWRPVRLTAGGHR